MTGETLRLAIFQSAPVLRDPAANAARIAAAAADSGADLLLTPELSLTGYDLRDDVHALARPLARLPDAFPAEAAGGADLVVGAVERGEDGVPYNAAVHLRGGAVAFRHRKIYLPTYGMFDEMRYFGRGGRVQAYDAGGGWRAGLLVCEDFWHPALPYLLSVHGARLLLVQAAAPGRDVWEGDEAGGRFGSAGGWERIARTTAQLYGIYVALANRVGVEGGLTFAGGSLVVGPDGGVLARAGDAAEETIAVDLSLEEVARARRPGAHARDEDPELVARELRRLLEDRDGLG